MIDLLSRPHGISPFFTKLLGGHYAVSKSILLGLSKQRLPFKLNPSISDIPLGSRVLLLSGAGHVPLLLTRLDLAITIGPNFTGDYKLHREFLAGRQVKTILLPSVWIRDLKALADSALGEKTQVWPAAVEIPLVFRALTMLRKDNRALLYIKHPDREIIEGVRSLLLHQGFKLRTLKYGAHSRARYLARAARSKILIYVGSWESQGLALQEAWCLGVRTLVLKRDLSLSPLASVVESRLLVGDHIAAPYLTTSSGSFWHSIEELAVALRATPELLQAFSMNEVLPKSYEESASRLWQIIHAPSDV
jgi:hypothetical protein